MSDISILFSFLPYLFYLSLCFPSTFLWNIIRNCPFCTCPMWIQKMFSSVWSRQLLMFHYSRIYRWGRLFPCHSIVSLTRTLYTTFRWWIPQSWLTVVYDVAAKASYIHHTCQWAEQVDPSALADNGLWCSSLNRAKSLRRTSYTVLG